MIKIKKNSIKEFLILLLATFMIAVGFNLMVNVLNSTFLEEIIYNNNSYSPDSGLKFTLYYWEIIGSYLFALIYVLLLIKRKKHKITNWISLLSAALLLYFIVRISTKGITTYLLSNGFDIRNSHLITGIVLILSGTIMVLWTLKLNNLSRLSSE